MILVVRLAQLTDTVPTGFPYVYVILLLRFFFRPPQAGGKCPLSPPSSWAYLLRGNMVGWRATWRRVSSGLGNWNRFKVALYRPGWSRVCWSKRLQAGCGYLAELYLVGLYRGGFNDFWGLLGFLQDVSFYALILSCSSHYHVRLCWGYTKTIAISLRLSATR
jgi:hypothetical protein